MDIILLVYMKMQTVRNRHFFLTVFVHVPVLVFLNYREKLHTLVSVVLFYVSFVQDILLSIPIYVWELVAYDKPTFSLPHNDTPCFALRKNYKIKINLFSIFLCIHYKIKSEYFCYIYLLVLLSARSVLSQR